MDEDTVTGYITPKLSDQQTMSEGLIDRKDPLSLDIKDEELVKIIDKRIEDIRRFNKNELDLYNRRKKNKMYLFGRQIAELERAGKIKEYQAKNLDNVLYEIENTIKPLAMAQLPDLIVTPGNDSDESKDISDDLSRAVDSDIKQRNNRKVLAQAFKHRPVYFVGVIKAIWDPELMSGKGDYRFEAINPEMIDLDNTASEADADKMSIIAQLVPITVKEVLMRFPKKKEEFIIELKKDGIKADEKGELSWKDLATEIKIREVWFNDYQKAKGDEWEKINGVCWKYEDVILEKMRNPNFDYEGEERVFTYEQPGIESSKRAINAVEMQQSMLTGQFPANVVKQQVYHNYFDNPRMPYYFMVYDQWGKQPLDETTHLEQNIKNQEALDNRIRQIEMTLNNQGHHVWSKESGLKPDDVERMDHNNPDEDYIVDGNVNDVHKFIEPARPTQQEFADKEQTRNRMYSLAGSNAVRGELQSQVATSNQIAREANYTRADDLVDETINPAAEWMAQWALQFIKLRYTQEHLRQVLGSKGEIDYIKLHQNLVDEGMIVMIKASGTDKIKAQNNAMEMARMQLTDPLSFFQDMGLDDPEGRTMKLLSFKASPPIYLNEFVAKAPGVTQDLIDKLTMMAPPPPPAGQPGMPPAPGAPVAPGQPAPAGPTVQNTAAVPTQPPPGVTASPVTGGQTPLV